MTIVTPEGVTMDLTLAGIGSRVVAGIVDLTIQVGLYFALFFTFLFAVGLAGGTISELEDSDDIGLIGIAILVTLAFIVTFFYFVFFEARSSGQTPGKRIAGIRVVRVGGSPVGFSSAAIRNIMRVVDQLPFLYILAILVILFSSRNQRLGDMIAGTVVIRAPTPARRILLSPRPVANLPPPEDLQAWDLGAVTNEDIAVVRMFLDRREFMTPEARNTLASDLAGRLQPKVHGPAARAPEAFLEQIAAAKAARA